ncbi:MAG: hypothetical protein DRJ38_04600 [Thermoprotei archaeon]|nr:MAG: hypothetical protein DRJ38_04600 [Thermoprotei archaeon]
MKAILAIRIIVVILLLILGTLSALTGVILYTAPRGSGESAIAFGLPKRNWSTLHTYLSFGATGVAVVHLYINWRALIYYIKKIVGK